MMSTEIKKILETYNDFYSANNLLVEFTIPQGCSGKLTAPGPLEKLGPFGKVKISPKVTPLFDVSLIEKIKRLYELYGEGFTIISGYRKKGGARCSQHFVHKAADIKLDNDSKENVLRFASLASQVGFNGIGIYHAKTIHIDVRPNKSIWGTGFGRAGIPDWAKETLQNHMSGKSEPILASKTPSKTDLVNTKKEPKKTGSTDDSDFLASLSDLFKSTT